MTDTWREPGAIQGTPRHVLASSQFTREDLESIFESADRFSQGPYPQPFTGLVLANLFFEPSTRTRLSFGSSFVRLGGSVLDTTSMEFSSMAKGESLADTARVMSGYADVIVLRHPVQGSVSEFARYASVPVINGGDGPGEHPTQALLDVYTIRAEKGRLHDLTIAAVGDLRYGRTIHSLVRLMRLFENVRFNMLAPDSLELPPGIEREAAESGTEVSHHKSLRSALSDADVVYVTRLQRERMTPQERDLSADEFALNAESVARLAKPGVTLMHPLPRDTASLVCELSTDLDDHPNMAAFRQARNGVPVRMALFLYVLDMEIGLQDRIVRTLRRMRSRFDSYLPAEGFSPERLEADPDLKRYLYPPFWG